MIFIIWTLVVIAALTLYLRQAYSRFSKYGVKHLKPMPFFGDMFRVMTRLEHFTRNFERVYDFPNERFVGMYQLVKPIVMIRDVELVKKITVKDFEYFLDHQEIFDGADQFFGRNLLSLKGQEWKDMRSTLSPAFTSSKIRHMLPFMVEVGDQMVMCLKEQIKQSRVGYVDIEGKDLTTRYANDVIASCAFGLKVNSHADQNNEFYEKGKEASTFKFKQLLKFFGFSTCPKLMSLLKQSLFSEEIKRFFQTLVLSTMRNREEQSIIRPDMIHLLMEAKKGRLIHEDKTALDAKAGFSTVEESSFGKSNINRVMSFSLQELTVNPEVQEKLAQEIRENEINNGGKFDYNSIQNMTYMDMVVSEVLRLWPPALGLDRKCIKDYNLGKANDKAQDYIIRKGEGISLPTWCFHRDPQYFPDPLKFDPERFSEANKDKINPLAYMPFGVGPRNCIGSRFALCEVKVMLYQLLQHFELSPCEKTSIPPVLSTDTFNLKIKGGQWMRMKLRT